jgi:hypothetical protein
VSKIKWHNFPDEMPVCRNGQPMYVRCHEVQSNKVRIVNLEIHICIYERLDGGFHWIDQEGNDIYDVAQWAIRKENKK